jgi:hypothetical protein
MDTDNNDPAKNSGYKLPHTFTAASASGASLTGRTLLPMLFAGLILFVVGTLVALFLI